MARANKLTDLFRHVNMKCTVIPVDAQGKPKCPTPCWPWTAATNAKGRPYFTVSGKKYIAYRLAYELVHGMGSLDGFVARHKCDNEICCNPAHIEKGTHDDNMDDMKKRERHGLPHHTVRAIRKLGSTPDGPTHQEIADLYGIGRSTVTEIINGDNYKHVD